MPGWEAALWVAAAAALAAPSAAVAAGTLQVPSFVNVWQVPNSVGASQIAVSPTGAVYVVNKTPIGDSRVQKFAVDGTPIPGEGFVIPDTPLYALAIDSQGHVFVAGENDGQLLEYTSTGGELASFKLAREVQARMEIGGDAHLYVAENDYGGASVLDEYSLAGPKPKLVHTGAFPGTVQTGYFPPGFFDVALDSAGNAYVNGASTTQRFIGYFAPGLAGAPTTILSCANPSNTCSQGYGLAIVRSRFDTGDEQALYVANAASNLATITSGRTEVYSLTPPVGPRGAFGPQPDPPPTFSSSLDVAASPCYGAVYILDNVFGGPGFTFSGNRIERYDTHATSSGCTNGLQAAVIGKFTKSNYTLVPLPKPPGPCTVCAPFGPSGEFIRRPAKTSTPLAKRKGGATLKFKASVAGDLTFTFRGPVERGKKAKKRGGFVFAAHQGKNKIRFTGAIQPRRPLAPGLYKVGVTTVDREGVGRLKFDVRRR
jgi:hypothetical protein